jgi:toxin CcdB
MAQFDVYKNSRGGQYPYLLDVQHDNLASFPSRVVVPLIPIKTYTSPTTRLHPRVTIAAVEYVLKFHDLGAVLLNTLGKPVLSLADRRSELIAAIDFLFTGS